MAVTLIFRDVETLEDYIAYCKKEHGTNPRVTARFNNGKFEFRTKVRV